MRAWLLVLAACKHDAAAQATRDPLAPVRCFQLADAKNLASDTAIQLCAGTATEAPGHCYVTGVNLLQALSTQQIVQLCTFATSLAPIECYRRLNDDGELTDEQIIPYCATTCPLGPPPPQASHPACLQGASRQTDLSNDSATQLCGGASSAGPVQCFVEGERTTQLAESQLVQLCAEALRCQYYNVIPPSY
jgi:hypothetical protein